MIYATAIIGKDFINRHAVKIQQEGVNKDLYVLTDFPELFPNLKTVYYGRKTFSYYEKLLFLVRLVIKRQQRVTFIDCDWFSGVFQKVNFDQDSFYTYKLFNFKNFNFVPFSLEGMELVKKVLSKNQLQIDESTYIGEAIMSLPYVDCIQEILNDLISLQQEWENTFSQNISTHNKQLLRYASYGVGYAEGGALTAILQKYNVKLKQVNKKLVIHNNII